MTVVGDGGERSRREVQSASRSPLSQARLHSGSAAMPAFTMSTMNPTEALLLDSDRDCGRSAIANVDVDLGRVEPVPMTISSMVAVESIPRPSDPCEVRFYPTDQPVVNTNRYHASQQTGDFVSLGYAYLTDACDNVVRGVGMDDSEEHNQLGDEFRVVNPPEPPEGGFGVWAIGNSTPDQWRYLLALTRTNSRVRNPDPGWHLYDRFRGRVAEPMQRQVAPFLNR